MVVLDFETYSPIDIDCGTIKYLMQDEADIVCLGYKIDDQPTQIWEPNGPYALPDFSGHEIYAHSASFDYLVWHIIGTKKYTFAMPIIPLKQWHDTMALANRYGFPGELDKLGPILKLPVHKKKSIGLALIKKICMPNKYGMRPQLGQDYTETELYDFQDYCKSDVDTTYHLVHTLPAKTLSDTERKIWDITFEMNMNGLPVDIDAVNAILDQIEIYTEEMMKLVPDLTGGAVQKITQVQRVREYLGLTGLKLPDLTAGTVDKALDRDDLTSTQRELLRLRKLLGSSSVKKYKKIRAQEFMGYVHFNLHYHGAAPGRWAGRGFQVHNLPRAKVEDPEIYLTKFKNYELVENPIKIAKALIRPVICAPEGYQLICADYRSIENVLLLYEADDHDALQLFAKGLCQYTDMAAYMYGKDYAVVEKSERQVGKVVILGCGYGMGPDRFLDTCKQWGVPMDARTAEAAVMAYRARYPKVVKFWYSLKDAAVSAIRNPGHTYKVNRCAFKLVKDKSETIWLMLILPSGRAIYYNSPFIEEDGYGAQPRHWGTNPYTKKWDKLRLIPGRLTENVIQGLARDVMANGLLTVKKQMPEILLLATVHDEGLGMLKKEDIKSDTLERYNNALCTLPSWLPGLPLEAEGWIGKRYRKG